MIWLGVGRPVRFWRSCLRIMGVGLGRGFRGGGLGWRGVSGCFVHSFGGGGGVLGVHGWRCIWGVEFFDGGFCVDILQKRRHNEAVTIDILASDKCLLISLPSDASGLARYHLGSTSHPHLSFAAVENVEVRSQDFKKGSTSSPRHPQSYQIAFIPNPGSLTSK